MKNTFAILGALITFASVIPSASAYNGYVSDVRYGEHPYEARTRDEDRRKRLAEDAEKYGYYTFDNPAYYHPIYAQRSVLHPFYRKGGVTQYIDSRYARWRGYLDPNLAHELSPDTYCSNFSYANLGGVHGQPYGYRCF